jgi:hypothetical protein
VTWPEVVAWQQAQALAATMPPKTSIATKYDQLERSEQVQVLQKEGIQPAAPTEVAAGDKREAKQEGEIAGAKAKEESKYAPKPDNGPAKKPASGKK